MGGGDIVFGPKDGHVSYPEFGLDAIRSDDDEDGYNSTHASIMKWLNSNVAFTDYYEQVMLSRLMYLTSYGICYPTQNRYTHMNAFLIHEKEKVLKYSKRWELYERYMNLNAYEYTGISLDAFLDKSPYETNRILDLCERKLQRNNAGVDNIRKQLEEK